jgi:gas vesicle protein
MMRYNDKDCGNGAASIILSFLLGGLVGAAAAFILAPKSGHETREQIKDMAQEAKEKAGEYFDQAKAKITSTVQKGTDAIYSRHTDTVEVNTSSQASETGEV